MKYIQYFKVYLILKNWFTFFRNLLVVLFVKWFVLLHNMFYWWRFSVVGIEVVKEGIRKLRFNQQLKKSESGAKTRKVELTISVDGVAIQEPRSHTILHQFPLHRISYCADDKGEKKFFSFIAKQPNQGRFWIDNL